MYQWYSSLDEQRIKPGIKEPVSHQLKALTDLHRWFEKDNGSSAGIMVVPTGGGKTFIAVRFLTTAPLSKGYKVLWLAHTHHLLDQAYRSFVPLDDKYGYEVGNIAETRNELKIRVVSGFGDHSDVSSIRSDDDIIIGTIQTITRAFSLPEEEKLKSFLDDSNGKLFVVFDEAHHSTAPTYRKFLLDLKKDYPQIVLLGMTATPIHKKTTIQNKVAIQAYKNKNSWLKKIYPQGIIHQSFLNDLMADGILAKPVSTVLNTEIDTEIDEKDYKEITEGLKDIPDKIINSLASNKKRNYLIADTYSKNKEKFGKTIIFADRFYQCESIAYFLKKNDVKVDSIYTHNERSQEDNACILERFKNDELDVLINIQMLTEGTDVPDVQTVFLTRQTTSSILMTQMVGRALRGPKFGGTSEANIVSFVDNWVKAINWAEFNLEDCESSKDNDAVFRKVYKAVSISLIHKLNALLNKGVNISPQPFLSYLPVGWYATETKIQRDGIGIEDVRKLLIVFEDEKEYYDRFIKGIFKADLSRFNHEMQFSEEDDRVISNWKNKYFEYSSCADHDLIEENLKELSGILHIMVVFHRHSITSNRERIIILTQLQKIWFKDK
jgi:superfamily II DNA or RNA helicase